MLVKRLLPFVSTHSQMSATARGAASTSNMANILLLCIIRRGLLAQRINAPNRWRLTGQRPHLHVSLCHKNSFCNALKWCDITAQQKRAGNLPPSKRCPDPGLQAVIHLKLERMRGHTEGGEFFMLERHVGLQHVLREYPAARQEFVILLELFKRLLERMTYLRYLRGDLRRQVVQVLVDWIARLDLVLDAVESRHHHRGEREIRVGGRIREAHFDTARLRAGNERHPHRRGTI